MNPYSVINYRINDLLYHLLGDTFVFHTIPQHHVRYKGELSRLQGKEYWYDNKSWELIANEPKYRTKKYQILNHAFEPMDENDKVWNHSNLEYLPIHSEPLKQGIHFFSHAYLCSEFYFKHYKDLKIVKDFMSRPIWHKWICPNRLIDNQRKYRIKFLNIIDTTQGVYSLLEKDPQTQRHVNEIFPGNWVKPNSFDSHYNSSAELEIEDLNPWTTSFLHIVPETIYGTNVHLTEKIFKPIVLQQPFVLLQAPGALKYLQRYGFKTFNDFWSEDYDDIVDHSERLKAIANIVDYIGNKTISELIDMRKRMSEILVHNFNCFYNFIPDITWEELKYNVSLYHEV